MSDRLTELQSKRDADERFLNHRETHELLRLQEQAIVRLTEESAELRQEIERLQADRAEVVSYLQAVATCSRLHPEGYTLVDFQQVWLNQERAKIERLTLEVNKLATACGHWEADVAERDNQIERLSDHQPHIVPSRRDVEIAELGADLVRLTEESAELRQQIESVKAENHLLRSTTSVTELDARLRLADCRRLLREAVLRDGLVDERWFEQAKKVGGGDD